MCSKLNKSLILILLKLLQGYFPGLHVWSENFPEYGGHFTSRFADCGPFCFHLLETPVLPAGSFPKVLRKLTI